MLWGLDAEVCPSAARLQVLQSLGWSFFGGYVGGVARGAASYSDGTLDGTDCLNAMKLRGLSSRVIADIEDGGGAANVWRQSDFASVNAAGLQINAFWVGPGGTDVREWLRGFVDACHLGSTTVALYGTSAVLDQLGDLVDDWYLAWWPTAGVDESQPQRDWVQWQYSDGAEYDYSVARDDAVFASFS